MVPEEEAVPAGPLRLAREARQHARVGVGTEVREGDPVPHTGSIGAMAAERKRMTAEDERFFDAPPNVPRDLAAALARAPRKIQDVWKDITPMARWETVRWVNATNNPDTRKRRVDVSISKMNSGKRRPCCFNLSACTDPQLARNGRLREPA
jgi:hypothetical protein